LPTQAFEKVVACDHEVWAVTAAESLVVRRRGFSAAHRCGTHWTLSNGLILGDFEPLETQMANFSADSGDGQ
jgi:hypothetical protein